MKLIDLTTTLRNQPGRVNPQIVPQSHEDIAIERARQIGIRPDQFPRPGVHFATEQITGAVHGSATHVDAPWHYGPESEGRPARTVDELPLEWFYGDAVVLDFSADQDGGDIEVADVERALGSYRVKPGDIILIRTDLLRSTEPERHLRLRQLTRASAGYLLDRGVRVIGVDFNSPDRSNSEELAKGHPERYYPAHHLGRDREYCIVELLTNLDQLPHDGFKVALFPLKIERGSGGWCRAVAFVP
jgi:kynurenine formamidase